MRLAVLVVFAGLFCLTSAHAQDFSPIDEVTVGPINPTPPAPPDETYDQAAQRLMVEDPYEPPPGKLFDEQSYLQNQSPLNGFNTVIVINKAATGPQAQTLRLYTQGRLVMVTKVSTGREDLEYVTPDQAEARREAGKGALESHWRHTTRGFFPLQRIEGADYESHENNYHMPYAMFFNEQHGLAVHQVPPDLDGGEAAGEAQLGHRASSGCVRVHKDFIQIIHSAVTDAGIAVVPVLDIKTGQPRVQLEATSPTHRRGYSTIVVVEEY